MLKEIIQDNVTQAPKADLRELTKDNEGPRNQEHEAVIILRPEDAKG